MAAGNRVIVEVLSPATQAVNLGDELAEYFRVPSIHHYLVVRDRRAEVIHHRRGPAGEIVTRVVTAGALVLDPPGITVMLGEIHAAPV